MKVQNGVFPTALSFKKVLSFRKACYFIAGGKSEWEKVIFAFISAQAEITVHLLKRGE